MHTRARWNRVGVTGPRDDDEIDRSHHFFPTMPGVDFGECIGADHEKNIAAFGLHALDGVNRIAFLFSRFETRRHESAARPAQASSTIR
jgi:hypothetical protein